MTKTTHYSAVLGWICLLFLSVSALCDEDPTGFIAASTANGNTETDMHQQMMVTNPDYLQEPALKQEKTQTKSATVVKSDKEAPRLGKGRKHARKSGPFGPGITKVDPQESVSSIGGPVWRVFVSMMILIGLIIGTLYAIKRLGRRFGAIPADAKINILTKLQLDPKNYLLMVKIYEQELLLGVSNENISVLSRYHSMAQEDTNDDNLLEDDDGDEEQLLDVGKSDFKVVNSDVVVDVNQLKNWGDMK